MRRQEARNYAASAGNGLIPAPCGVSAVVVRGGHGALAGFQPVEEILADTSGFETWSQICLKALFGAN